MAKGIENQRKERKSMRQVKTTDILTAGPYYNVSILLMINKGNPQHAVHFYGEAGAFAAYKEAVDWANHLRNCNPLHYPIGLTLSNEIIRPHYHLTACCLAGVKVSSVLDVHEGAPKFGEEWLGDYNKKSEIIEFYSTIPEIFGLLD